jgi:WD40 repeat protein
MGFFDKLFGKSATSTPSLAANVAIDGHPIGLSFAAGDRKLAVLTGEGTLSILDVKTASVLSATIVHPDGGLALSVDASTGRIATGGMDGRARVIDATSGAIERDAELPKGGWIEHLAWWDTTLVCGHGKRVSAIDRAGTVRTIGDHASTVGGVSVVGDRLAVARFGGADLWSLGPNIEGPIALEWPSSLVAIAWSPDLRFLAAGCQDSALHFWRMPSRSDSMMGGYESKPKHLAWSPDSAWLATAGGRDVVVWSYTGEGPEGTTPLQLRGHDRSVSALAYALDGKILVSGGRDGRVCVWRSGVEADPIARLDVGGVIERVAISDDGAWIAAASSEGRVTLYRR